MAYRGAYGADSGGGFTESIALDSQTAGQYAASGDTWGMRVSTSWGNEWWGSMSGIPYSSPPPHSRACFFSKRVATKGLRFYGIGANGSSGGGFYYGLPGGFVVNQIGGTANGFGLGLSSGSGVNGTARRPCGQLIDSYLASGDNEYIFTLTLSGLDMFANTSGASGVAAKAAAIPSTPTTLLTSTDIGNQQRLFVEVLDATRLVVINWDHTVTNGPAQPTDVYLVYTTATNWSGATSGNTHALGPLSITPPKGRVYEIHRGKDGNIYAAAGYDGVYTVTLGGTGAGSTLAWSKPSGQNNDLIVCSVDADSTGVVYAGQTAGAVGGTSYQNVQSGMTSGHSVIKSNTAHTSWSYPASGGAIHMSEFQAGDTATATGRTWWLSGRDVPLSHPAHDVGVIRVDPFDDQKVILCGRSGSWMTRNGGTAWYPAMRGLNGGQTGTGSPHIVTTGPSSWSADNTDFNEAHTTNNWATAINGSSFSASGGRGVNLGTSGSKSFTGDDGKTYVFTHPTASAPAKVTQNGTKISDDRFEGAIVAASSMAVSQNGTVGVFQNGGATFILDPNGGGGGGGGPTPPVITSFTPTTQSVGGTVTVTGSGFTGASSVKVNMTLVVTYSILDDGTLTLTVPSGATTGAITITTPNGTATSGTALNVTGAPPSAPTINTTGGVSPLSGTPGTTITITGTNLASASTVKIGGSSGTTVTPVTDTSTTITFRIPVGAISGNIFVQTTGGSVTSAETLTVLPSPSGGGISNLPQGALSRTATMQIPGRPMWTTDQQAAQVAQECVFMSVPITAPRLATVMQANPNIIVAPYLKSIQNPAGTGDYDALGTKYPSRWYAHMKDGTQAKQTGAFTNWVMESGYNSVTRVSATVTGPLSNTAITATSWAQHHVLDAITAVSQWNARAAQSGTRPFRGLWFDTMGVFSANATPGFWTSTTNPGWNPQTNAAYTKPQFDSMAYYIGDQARTASINPANLWVVGNGLRVTDGTDVNGNKISAHVDMAMSEGWVATGGAAVPMRTAAAYQALLQLALDCQADGAVAELYEWGSTSDTAAITSQRRRFAAASDLIVNRGLATFEFSQLKTTAPWLETGADPNLYTMNLGLPLNGQSPTLASGHAVAVGGSNGQASSAGLYARSYDGGIAITNPTSGAITYKADRAYDTVATLGGSSTHYAIGASISIPAATGFIATTAPSGSAPANTFPPYILNSLVEGETLRRDEGIWTGNPAPTFSDQWQWSPDGSTSWADITGATSSTFPIPFSTGSATTIAADAYARTVASGWGTADTGGTYTIQQGVSTDFAVTSSGGGSTGGFVQLLDEQGPSGTSTTLTLTIPTGGVPTGHTVIVAAGSNNKAVSSITDSRSNTYQNDAGVLPASGTALNIYSAKVTTALLAGDTITITYSTTVGGRCAVACEYQGFLTTSWNDAPVTHTTSSTANATTSTNTCTTATAQANEIIVSAITLGSGSAIGSPTADANYTLRGTVESTGTIRRVALQSKKDSATETPSATWSWAAGAMFSHAITSYKLVAATAAVGTISHSSANTGKMITLAVNTADVDVYWDSNFPTAATGGNLQSSVMVRFLDTNNFLDLNATLSSSTGALSVAPRKVIAGTATTLGTAKQLASPYSTSDYVHYRFKVVGNHIQGKAWLGAASEPGSWDWDFNDSSIIAAGAIGARSFKGLSNTNTNPITNWDNLTATGVVGTVTGYVGDYFRDNVTGTNSNGSLTVASIVAGPVTAGAANEPQWTALPSLDGSPAEGQTLTTNPGTITGTPTPTVTYQWQTSSDGSSTTWTNVTSATASTWSVPTGYANLYTRCQVTASNSVKTVVAYTRKAGPIVGSDTLPQFTAPPSIAGSPITGQTLAMSIGTVTGSPTPTTTQVWQTSPDNGATWIDTLETDTSYLLTGTDAGALVRVAVTATNRVGQTQAFSAPVGPVQQPTSSGLTIGVSVE